MLDVIGLDRDEEEVYRCLVHLATARPDEGYQPDADEIRLLSLFSESATAPTWWSLAAA